MSINSTTNSTTIPCHPLLLNLTVSNPGLFRSIDFQQINVHGICPDTYVSMSVSLAFLLGYVTTFIFALIGVIWKRNTGNIQARSLSLLLFALFSELVFVLPITLRVIIGRRIYPCFLLTISFFLIPPIVVFPTTFRCLRLYVMYRLNLKKTTMLKEDVTPSSSSTTLSSQSASDCTSSVELMNTRASV